MDATWSTLTEPLPFSHASVPMLLTLGTPMFMALLVLLLRPKGPNGGAAIAIGCMGLASASALWLLGHVLHESIHLRFVWIELPAVSGDDLPVRLTGGLRADELAALMGVLVTGIAMLVLIFSVAYMRGERYLYRYWGYLGLFCSAMLMIIFADNLLFIYIGWELVGVSSYLLIGFWFTKEIPARASQKAFIVNRIGDLGFLLGMLILFSQCGTLDLVALETFAQTWTLDAGQWQVNLGLENGTMLTRRLSAPWLTAAGILLFFGCVGKSAQFPLQIWLPDAMAGPTPVSSLIHAATMVAAGVYLIARIFFLFDETALLYIAATGAITALMAALAATSQWDIKAVLAYSTISQLGYMVMAIGVGARDMALFHLFTHAFFKCALFLSAGVVIHQLHEAQHGLSPSFDAQDLRQMGGLRLYMPRIFWLYLLPMLALSGLPLTSGFLSKDGILVAAWDWAEYMGGAAWLVPLVGLVTTGLTAFYMARHAWFIWGGANVRAISKISDQSSFIQQLKQPVSRLMWVPLTVLGIGSLWIGFGLNPLDADASWLIGAISEGIQATPHGHGHSIVPWGSILLTALGLGVGAWRYRNSLGTVSPILANHFFQDKAYEQGIARAGLWLSRALAWVDRNLIDGLVNVIGRVTVQTRSTFSLAGLAAAFDEKIIDGFVNGIVAGVSQMGRLLRRVQSGRLQQYLLWALAGTLLLMGALWA